MHLLQSFINLSINVILYCSEAISFLIVSYILRLAKFLKNFNIKIISFINNNDFFCDFVFISKIFQNISDCKST